MSTALSKSVKRRPRLEYWKRNYEFYLFLIPGLFIMFMFDILPMRQITIAFVNFKPLKGISGSDWVGFGNFAKMFNSPDFFKVVRNTLLINLMKIIFVVPLPMFVAVMLNEMKGSVLKRSIQTAIYVPHFFTWVVVFSVFYIIFGASGIVNTLIMQLGGNKILFFMKGNWFRFLLVLSEAWHNAGWGTIVYLAAISAIDTEIFEAAIVDGATKTKQIRFITFPCLLPTLILMLTINMGRVMTSGFDQVLAFYNPTVYDAGDIISTYVYRMGIGQAQFSYASAVGLFNSLIGFILVMSSNAISKLTTGKTVW